MFGPSESYLRSNSSRCIIQVLADEHLDVYLCRFVSPHLDAGEMASAPATIFGGELRLVRATVRQADDPHVQGRYLLVQLDWLAEKKPTVDYRVTLRLQDEAGDVVVQRDEFPIGVLLPPTTWNAGDAKPGYMVLPLPDTLPPGELHGDSRRLSSGHAGAGR